MFFTAYQCAKGCDSEPNCKAFVMRLTDIPCARKSQACSENETNSNGDRVFYVKGQIGSFSKRDKRIYLQTAVKNLFSSKLNTNS